jgi:MFS superfamily sulfate permease-like transporter
LVTLAVLLVLSRLAPRAPVALIGMLGASAAVALLGLRDRGIAVVGEIPAGVPVPGLPDVAAHDLSTLIGPAVGFAFDEPQPTAITARARRQASFATPEA